MYQFVTAFLRKKGQYGIPEEVDVRSVELTAILDTYDYGHLVLTNPQITGEVYVDLLTLRSSELPIKKQPLDFWLGAISNQSIPSVPRPVYTPSKTVRFVEAWAHGVNVSRVSPYNEDVLNVDGDDLVDALVQFKNGEFENANRFCCFTIGGYGHFSEQSADGVRIKDATRTMESSTNNLIGILDFSELGEIVRKRITPSMVSSLADYPLSRTVVLDTGMDLTNKSIMCFVLGFLHGEHDIVRVVNRKRGLIRLNMNEIDLGLLLAVCLKHLSLGNSDLFSTTHPNSVDLAKIRTDDAIRSLLELPQSFLVIVDVPEYSVTALLPEQSLLNGRVVYPASVGRVGYPLIDIYGRFIPYLIKAEPDALSQVVAVTDTRIPTLSINARNSVRDFYEGGDVNDIGFKMLRPLLIQAQ